MITNEIMAVINLVAEKLGVAADKVYPMLLQQTKVFCSTYHVTLWIVGISFALFVAAIIALCLTKDIHDEFWFFLSLLVGLIAGVVFLISGIVALADLQRYLTAIHNPEWWAIEYVGKMLK